MTSSSCLNAAANHQQLVSSCECAEAILGLQKAIAALQRRVENIERNELVNDETGGKILPPCSGYVEPSKTSWKALEPYISPTELRKLLRRSGNWRKLVTNLVCSIFTKDVLIQSSVTGRNTQNAQLDPERRNAILDFVMDAYPNEGIEVSDFNQIILGKIKNLRHIHKTKKK